MAARPTRAGRQKAVVHFAGVALTRFPSVLVTPLPCLLSYLHHTEGSQGRAKATPLGRGRC